MNLRTDLQGLRALAFVFVLLFHINPDWLPGGFIGVDMFFVISGYLITMIITKKQEKGTFKIFEFYEGRFKRIIPAYYFLLLIVAVSGYFTYLYVDMPTLRRSLISAGAFVSNYYFGEGESYFGARLWENPLLHTWSLGIEMQFYFLLPLMLYFTPKKLLPYILIALIICITGITEWQLQKNGFSSSVYFSLISRIPEFLVGSFLSVVFKDGIIYRKRFYNTIGFSGLGLLLVGVCIINENTPFPGLISFIPTTAISLLLITPNSSVSNLLKARPLVWIGDLSYSLYLWHWPIMAYIRYTNGIQEGYVFSVTEIATIIVFTFVLAYLSYLYVESTFRTITFKNFIFKISIIALPLLASTFFLVKASSHKEIPFNFIATSFAVESNNQPIIEILGQKDKQNRFALIGDSHAQSLKPYFDELGKSLNFSMKTITCNSFPAIHGIDINDASAKEINNYRASRKLVPITDSLIKESNLIFLNAIGFDIFPSLRFAVDSLAKSLGENQKLIVIKTFPILEQHPVRLNKSLVKMSNMKYKIKDKTRYYAVIDSLANRNHNIIVLDLSNSHVFDDIPFYRDTIAYYDDRHLNEYGAINLAKQSQDSFYNQFRDYIQ